MLKLRFSDVASLEVRARRRCRYKKQREEPDWKEDKEEQKKQRLEGREKPSPTHSAVGIYALALHPAFALRSLAM